MGNRRGWVLGAVGVCVLLVVAWVVWGGSSTEGDDRGTWALSPPGTPLGDGFEVVDGTSLIADPIPLGVGLVRNGVPIVDDGWTATMVVDDAEPREILDAYLAQAEAVGLTDQVPASCRVEEDEMHCRAFARTPTVDEPRSLGVDIVRGLRDDVYSNHAVVQYATTDSPWEHGRFSAGSVEPQELPEARDWDRLPQVGDPIGRAGVLWSDVIVQEGSHLVGPVHSYLGVAGGGVSALLEVTGDPAEVLRSYLDAAGDGFDEGPQRVLDLDGGGSLTQAGTSEAGGDHLSFALVERPGRPTWLVIEGTHD